MNKLANDFRIAVLGAACGLFTFSVFLLFDRIDSYYSYLSEARAASHPGYDYVASLWWIPTAFWHALLFALASLAAHRYLAGGRRSPFILWQVIGLAALSGWLLTIAIGAGLECLMQGEASSLERAADLLLDWFTAKFVTVVFACNVAYGSLIQGAASQYPALPDASGRA